MRYDYVINIDFGTAGSICSYTHKTDTKMEDIVTPDGDDDGTASCKQPTVVTMNKHTKTFKSFGKQAKRDYVKHLVEFPDPSSRSLVQFQTYKMCLMPKTATAITKAREARAEYDAAREARAEGAADGGGAEEENDASQEEKENLMIADWFDKPVRERMVVAADGTKMLGVTVVAETLRCLANDVLAKIRGSLAEGTPVNAHDQMWVLTVPAVWDLAGQQVMREVAQQAGLVPTADSKQLIVCLEPEAATWHAVNTMPPRDREKMDTVGFPFMVVDCGGGTVDITVHKVAQTSPHYKLDEVTKAEGDNLGGRLVDRHFCRFLKKLLNNKALKKTLGASVFDVIEKENAFLTVMDKWEAAKSELQLRDTTTKYRVDMSEIIVSLNAKSEKPITLEKLVAKYNKDRDPALVVEYADSDLVLPFPFMNAIFEPVVEEIVKLTAAQIDDAEAEGAKPQYMVLCGGFGECKYLQQKMMLAFNMEGSMKVICCRSAGLAVSQGAVRYGIIDPSSTTTRMPMAIGIATSHEFRVGIDKEENKRPKPGGRFVCENVFKTYVKVNEEVRVDDPPKSDKHYPMDREAEYVELQIVASRSTEARGPRYIDDPDVFRIGTVTVGPLGGSHLATQDRGIEVSFNFRARDVEVKAVALATGTVVERTLKFERSEVVVVEGASSLYTPHAGQTKAPPDAPRDKYGNAKEVNKYDLVADGALVGRDAMVLVYQGYTGEGFDFHEAKGVLERKGFTVKRYTCGAPPSLAQWREDLKACCQVWICSGADEPKLSAAHFMAVGDAVRDKKGLYLWADNAPYLKEANILARRVIDPSVSIDGNDYGDKPVHECTTRLRGTGFKKHLVTTGLEVLYEGITVSGVKDPKGLLEPLLYGTEGSMISATWEPASGERVIFDGGFTRLFEKFDTHGTERYVANAAAWLYNQEARGVADFSASGGGAASMV